MAHLLICYRCEKLSKYASECPKQCKSQCEDDCYIDEGGMGDFQEDKEEEEDRGVRLAGDVPKRLMGACMDECGSSCIGSCLRKQGLGICESTYAHFQNPLPLCFSLQNPPLPCFHLTTPPPPPFSTFSPSLFRISLFSLLIHLSTSPLTAYLQGTAIVRFHSCLVSI